MKIYSLICFMVFSSNVLAQNYNFYSAFFPNSFIQIDEAPNLPVQCQTLNHLPEGKDTIDGYNILASITGKGVVTHSWFVYDVPDSAAHLKIWVDDSLIAFGTISELVTRGNGIIRPPLAFKGSGSSVCDVQVPYTRNFRITYHQTLNDLFWYAIQWRRIDPLIELPRIGSSFLDSIQHQAEDRFRTNDFWKGYLYDSIEFNHFFQTKDTATLCDINESGIIQELYIYPSLVDQASVDNLLLEFYWDHNPNPSLRVTVGDLFGTLVWPRTNTSLFIKTDASGNMKINFPMPFSKHATIKLINTRDYAINVQGHMRYSKQKIDRNTIGYFGAEVRRSNPTKYHIWHPVLHTLGKGKYIGMMLQIPSFNQPATLEGDPRFMIDSNEENSFRLTGTEDYFNGGNYYLDGPLTNAFGGCFNWATGMCRFHCFDAMNFTKSFDFDLQHGFNTDVKEDYRSVAFYYKQWTPFWTSRDTIRAGEKWNVSGDGYQQNQPLELKLNGSLIGRSIANAEGRFNWDTVVSKSFPIGKQYLSVNDEVRPEPIYIIGSPTIRLIVDSFPVMLEVGEKLHFTATGFSQGEAISVFLDSIKVGTVDTTIVDNNYRLETSIVIPRLQHGNHILSLRGDISGEAVCETPICVTKIRNYEFEELLPATITESGKCYEKIMSIDWWSNWSKQSVAQFTPSNLNEDVQFNFILPERDSFFVYIFTTIGTKYGNYSYSMDGLHAGAFVGYYKGFDDRTYRSDTLFLGKIILDSGKHSFSFTYLGHNPNATDSLLGADNIVFIPISIKKILDSNFSHSDSPLTTISTDDKLIIFPNPVTDGMLHCELDSKWTDAKITITDILGRTIYTKNYGTHELEKFFSLDLGKLAQGKYSLRLEGITPLGLRHISAPFVVVH